MPRTWASNSTAHNSTDAPAELGPGIMGKPDLIIKFDWWGEIVGTRPG